MDIFVFLTVISAVFPSQAAIFQIKGSRPICKGRMIKESRQENRFRESLIILSACVIQFDPQTLKHTVCRITKKMNIFSSYVDVLGLN